MYRVQAVHTFTFSPDLAVFLTSGPRLLMVSTSSWGGKQGQKTLPINFEQNETNLSLIQVAPSCFPKVQSLISGKRVSRSSGSTSISPLCRSAEKKKKAGAAESKLHCGSWKFCVRRAASTPHPRVHLPRTCKDVSSAPTH